MWKKRVQHWVWDQEPVLVSGFLVPVRSCLFQVVCSKPIKRMGDTHTHIVQLMTGRNTTTPFGKSIGSTAHSATCRVSTTYSEQLHTPQYWHFHFLGTSSLTKVTKRYTFPFFYLHRINGCTNYYAKCSSPKYERANVSSFSFVFSLNRTYEMKINHITNFRPS